MDCFYLVTILKEFCPRIFDIYKNDVSENNNRNRIIRILNGNNPIPKFFKSGMGHSRKYCENTAKRLALYGIILILNNYFPFLELGLRIDSK